MKKVIIFVLGTVMALSLTACGNKKENDSVQIANPYTDYNTLDEAMKVAGFSLNTPEEPVVLAPGEEIVSVSSIEELSNAVGFEVTEISQLPFNVEQTEYTSYWNEMAQITYMNDEQSLVYRKSLGTDDNSGDYTIYESQIDTKINDVTVKLNGNGDIFYLATWSEDGYSYSIRIENGLGKTEFINVLSHNLKK